VGGGRIQCLPTPVPRKPSQETGCRLHACHKRVACVDISRRPYSLGSVSQAMTHAPRNGEGEKVSPRILLLKSSPLTPRALKHTRTVVLNFGFAVLGAPFSFSAVGMVVQRLQTPVSERRPCAMPSRLVHVLKPILSHRPHSRFFFSGRFSDPRGTWDSGLGSGSPQVWFQNLHLAPGWGRGGLY
jgi:hypothetical protein